MVAPLETYNIEREIERFAAIDEHVRAHSHLRHVRLEVEKIDEFGWLLSPEGGFDAGRLATGKDIALTLMGIVHGNEWGGIAVLNAVLDLIAKGTVTLTAPTAFLLGNPQAAKANKRFLEKDLNRSFDVSNPTHKEELRALALQKTLTRTARLVDFHQTSRPCDRPFFIFPHSDDAYAFAREILPRQTIVTHWGKPFSVEGRCSDEFVNSRGGIGVTIELGQNGFDPYQVSAGTVAAIASISAVSVALAGPVASDKQEKVAPYTLGPIFTWGAVLPWPEEGVVTLRPGLDNFTEVKEGEELGRAGSTPILAPVAGRMLFAKYLTPDQQANLTSRPTELCRIMKQVEANDLPKR